MNQCNLCTLLFGVHYCSCGEKSTWVRDLFKCPCVYRIKRRCLNCGILVCSWCVSKQNEMCNVCNNTPDAHNFIDIYETAKIYYECGVCMKKVAKPGRCVVCGRKHCTECINAGLCNR